MREAACSGQIQRVQDSQISLRFLRLDDACATEQGKKGKEDSLSVCALQRGGQEGRQVGWAQLRWSRSPPCSERGRQVGWPPGATGAPHSPHKVQPQAGEGRWGRPARRLQHWGSNVPALCLPLRGASRQSLASEEAVLCNFCPCLSCRTTFSTPGFSYELQCETIILENETSSGRLWKSSESS